MSLRGVCAAILLLVVVVGANRAQAPADGSSKPLTEQQKNRLEERDRLAPEYRKQVAAGNLPGTIAVLEKGLVITREVFGDAHKEVAGTVEILAQLHEAAEDFASARKARAEVVAIRSKLYGKDNWQVREPQIRLEDVDRLERLDREGRVRLRQAEERIALEQPQLAPLLGQIRQARTALARISQSTPRDPKFHAQWVAALRTGEADKEKLETELALKSAAYRRNRSVAPAEVVKALPADAAFVDLLAFAHITPVKGPRNRYNFDHRFLAFVLRRGREPIVIELGRAQPIEEVVTAWRKTGLNSLVPDANARKLDELVWQPIRKHLGDAKTVYLSPDGALAKFPFAALPGSKPGTFLLEEMTFVHVTSGRHLLELTDERNDPKAAGLLAVGALDFGKSTVDPKGWQELLGTRLETQNIADAFRKQFPSARQPQVLTGGDIDVNRLRREMLPPDGQRWRFLHLATHGTFQEPRTAAPPRKLPDGPLTQDELRRLYTYDRNPLLSSWLVLSGANTDPGKGVLTAEEVLGMDLRGTELAVLSACETGLGKVSGSQGVQGLQLAFHTAGVRTLTASLWNVEDAATSVLIKEFYANLWQKKLSRAEALRQAQLTVLKNPDQVLVRRKQLHDLLVKRGVPEEVLASRGLGKAQDLPGSGKVEAGAQRSKPAWWAAFLLSGDPSKLD